MPVRKDQTRFLVWAPLTEAALWDKAAELLGTTRTHIIRKGATEHARRVIAAIERAGQAPTFGVPLLQSGLPPELCAPSIGDALPEGSEP